MPRSVRRIAGAFLFSFLGLAQAASLPVPKLFVPVPVAKGGAATNAMKEAVPLLSDVRGEAHPVKLNTAALLQLRFGDEVDLVLPSGKSHRVVFEEVRAHGGGISSWIGHIKELGTHNRVIFTVGPSGAFGVIDAPEGTKRVIPGGDFDWLIDGDAEERLAAVPGRPDDGKEIPVQVMRKALPDPQNATILTASPKAEPSPRVEVDILFVVTNGLASRLGASLETRLNFLVTRANDAYQTSEIALRLRKVGTVTVNWPDNTNDSLALHSISPGCAGAPSFCDNEPYNPSSVFTAVESTRNQLGADLVSFLRDGAGTGGSGVAWLGAPSLPSDLAYSTMNGCVTGCESVWIHEVGHNMGANHDRATTQWQRVSNGQSPTITGSNYGYAYCSGGALTCDPATGACGNSQPECLGGLNALNFSDIMAYFQASTRRLNVFSNPNILCRSPTDTGASTPCGQAGLSDAAAFINGTRVAVSSLRAGVSQLQFTSASYSGSETGGSIIFTVSRTGPVTAAASVNFTVSSGTAIAGVDFQSTSGTLNWAAGDGANKSFTVNLINDGLAEGIESFGASLSSPTGAQLGSAVTAAGVITAPFPVGAVGTLPQPFTGPWAIANDFSPDGDGLSLKSGALAFSGGIPSPSVMQVTGNFIAGIVSFSYQVDAYPGFGFFEFLVDGQVQLSDTGRPGAKTFAVAIPAGNHTLQWRYRSALTFECMFAVPSGQTDPPYPTCADRAWIDQVSLPLAAPSSTTVLTTSVNPSTSGQSVTFTATVTGGSGTPTGTVNFRDGGATIGSCGAVALNGAGVATCATTALALGTRSITAVYSGSATYAGSTSNTVSQVVSGVQLLSSNPGTLAFGGQSMNTTSPALVATLTNSSGAPVTVTSVTPATNYAIIGNTCSVVAVGGKCDITVTFTPTAEGNRDGVILVNYAGGGPTPVLLTGTGERSLVTHYYRSILRRAPDGPGKAYWLGEAARVQALGANVNEVWFAMAIQFFFSPEYTAFNRDNTGFVTDLYTTFFNRAPDGAGLAFWLSQMAGGMPREVVLAGFMFSPEFTNFTQAIFGTQNVRAEMDVVMDFYRGLLSRLPDDAGFNFWVGQFRAAQCAGAGAVFERVEAISSGFAEGPEYASRNRSNGQFVGDLYNSFLRRGGDLPGVNFWIGQLQSGARSRPNERQAFITTPEFNARVQAIIAQGCL